VTIGELRAMSISELEDYLNALSDLPAPMNEAARANFRLALHALRDKYDQECAAALGLSLAEYHEFSDAIVAWWWSTQTRQ
jgi:hypothetical protein